jgi:hypothetical protein
MVGEMSGRRACRLERLGWGRCFVSRKVYTYPGEPWFLDNGAFKLTTWARGKQPSSRDPLYHGIIARPRPNGDGMTADEEREWLRRFRGRCVELHDSGAAPLFAVLPDAPFAGLFSLDLSVAQLAEMGPSFPRWTWYLPVQDGMKPADVTPILGSVGGLFIGGSDPFKRETGREWVRLAHGAGLPCHYGRCGTPDKLRHAVDIGADSGDSAFVLFRDDRFIPFAALWAELTDAPAPIRAYIAEGCPLEAP